MKKLNTLIFIGITAGINSLAMGESLQPSDVVSFAAGFYFGFDNRTPVNVTATTIPAPLALASFFIKKAKELYQAKRPELKTKKHKFKKM